MHGHGSVVAWRGRELLSISVSQLHAAISLVPSKAVTSGIAVQSVDKDRSFDAAGDQSSLVNDLWDFCKQCCHLVNVCLICSHVSAAVW